MYTLPESTKPFRVNNHDFKTDLFPFTFKGRYINILPADVAKDYDIDMVRSNPPVLLLLHLCFACPFEYLLCRVFCHFVSLAL
jgi:hypothetical protein